MLTRPPSRHVRGRWPLVAAAALAAAAAPTVHALTFVYACLCCRQPGNQVVYKTGWIEGGCDKVNTWVWTVDCDDLFTAFTLPGSGGVGNGYSPAFDRAVTLGTPIVSSDGTTVTRIVQGTYPVPDPYTSGSSTYSTRIFAIREGAVGTPNQFAPIDLDLTGLSPAADSITISSVPGGVPIELFDMTPGPVIAGGDVTIVVHTFSSTAPCCDPLDDCSVSFDFAALNWQTVTPLPPACLGDCDRSGGVSFADVTSTLANFGASYPVGVLNLGDANGDRVVNFGDVTTILANFGATCM